MTPDEIKAVRAAAERQLAWLVEVAKFPIEQSDHAKDIGLLANFALAETDSYDQLVFIVNALAESRLGCSCRIGCHLCDPVADFLKRHKELIKPREQETIQ